ncbi:caffeoylshikimate esterase [Syzygium oleosum]|uniref:caffeoylshikimate esterase n=1 Tax=Syzygium oleosum TaxID=219896 RepID=UPI0024BA333B|nr:caffeoylshikimate esterase [Syzygium oleosum]
MGDDEQQEGGPKNLKNYWGNTPEEEDDYFRQQGVRGTTSFHTSPRGLTLFARSWQPLSAPPRGVVLMVHGYGNDVTWTFQMTPIFLAQHGFACFAFDLEGHGRSQGLQAFVPDVDLVVDDAISYFDSIKNDPRFQGLPRFLYGESMGGAICLLIHFRDPVGYRGAVLVAPMCKISDKVRPVWPIPQVLSLVARVMPTLPIVPTADIMKKSVKVEAKKAIAEMNPMRYRGKPRLGTVLDLLRVTDYLNRRLGDVKIPFIVLHGSEDAVTDPDVSRALYQEAQSDDKAIRICEGMMHSLLFGETEENIEVVRRDILSWLEERCEPRLEN